MASAEISNPSENRKPWQIEDRAHLLASSEPSGTSHSGDGQKIENASAAFVHSNVLPDLQIDGLDPHSAPQESGFMHYVNGAAAVVTDLTIGAVDEAIHHPVELVGTALTGLAIGATAAVVAPEVAIGAAVIGAGYGAYELATHVGAWINAADVVSNAQDHTAEQLKTAHEHLQDLGGGAALFGAGAIGSLGGAPLAGAISDFIAGSAVDAAAGAESGTFTDIIANQEAKTVAATEANPVVAAAEVNPTAPSTEANPTVAASEVNPTTPSPEANPTVAAIEVNPTAPSPEANPVVAASEVNPTAVAPEATVAASDLGLTPAERAAMTPEQFSALQESVARNQSIFRAAQERGEVVPSVKQLYSVRFDKVGPEGRLVPTLENPAGVQLKEGGWVATRLNADGTPNIENGMVNQWTPSAKDIAKQYLVTPEQLASQSNLIGQTNTTAPPVHMVQLDAPMDFQTRWGSMHADAGDWLSNYDFSAGQAGNNFARVTAQSYKQTYRPVTPED